MEKCNDLLLKYWNSMGDWEKQLVQFKAKWITIMQALGMEVWECGSGQMRCSRCLCASVSCCYLFVL
jgi:hypothetical protein